MCITHELLASLNPFSIAGMKFEGIACPMIRFSTSNFVREPNGRGSIYLLKVKKKKNKESEIKKASDDADKMNGRQHIFNILLN